MKTQKVGCYVHDKTNDFCPGCNSESQNRILNGSHPDGIFPDSHTPTLAPHTAYPLKVAKGSLVIRDAQGNLVSDTCCDQDAAFIVRAVNSHDALMRLLEIVLADQNVEEYLPENLLNELEIIARAEGK